MTNTFDTTSDAVLIALVVIELAALSLSVFFLLLVAIRVATYAVTPMDGLSISVSSSTGLIAVYRVLVLVSTLLLKPHSGTSLRANRSEFTISGYYLTILWATLYVGMNWTALSPPYLPVVSLPPFEQTPLTWSRPILSVAEPRSVQEQSRGTLYGALRKPSSVAASTDSSLP